MNQLQRIKMYKIRYCVAWNYKPQAERLSVEMNSAGFHTIIEEGENGQFELFYGEKSIKKGGPCAGDGSFFSLEDIKELLW